MAFGLSAAILSPVIPPLLSHWGYETINLVLGCIALSVGLAASALIRFPEVDMAHLEGIWLWTTLAAVIGFAFGTLFAVTAPLTGDCFGLANFGAIFGLIFTAYGLFPVRWVRG